jgi:putative integral membrane protein (TIGR02587 family)
MVQPLSGARDLARSVNVHWIMTSQSPAADVASGREFLTGLGRAFAGALIFSLPMTMTEELWSLGFYIDPLRLALLLVLLVPLLVCLSRIGGFRNNVHWTDDVADALVAIAVGACTGAAFLWLFGILTAEMPLQEILGKISMQLFPASIGAMLAQNQLGGAPRKQRIERTYVGELFLMAVGGLFLSLNVAPTEEVSVISYKMGIWHLLALCLLSMALMHLIVYAANFWGSATRAPAESFLSVFARFTVVGYAIVALVNLYLLWTFGRVSDVSMEQVIGTVVVLSFPGAIGAAAARLIL